MTKQGPRRLVALELQMFAKKRTRVLSGILKAMKPSLERVLELQRLLAAFNQVDRVTHRKHAGKYVNENDTEHSYNLAMTAWFLARSFPELNVSKVITYSLVHDLVEVHAGDTYIYGSPEEINSKHEREAAALKKLEHDWTDFSDLTAAIHDYENKANSEAKFVYALDKLMPVMQIYIHDGYSWNKHGVTLDMLHANKATKVAQSPEIEPYFYDLYELLLAHPELIKRS
jgi:putative hydrolases of HD superfamily